MNKKTEKSLTVMQVDVTPSVNDDPKSLALTPEESLSSLGINASDSPLNTSENTYLQRC